MTDLRFDRTMSDAEAMMWRLDHDPFLSSTFGSVSVLDRAPDFDSFRRRLERATIEVPRLRQRVVATPGNLTPPIWVDDPNFDIDVHVRRVACPKPGTLRQVLDMASVIVADPFDRTRPLWQFTVVEGLKGGKAAVIQKMHHTITDGERGIQLALAYVDFERDAPEPPPIDIDVEPRADTTTADMVRELLAGGMRVPTEVAKQVRELLADPASLPHASAAAARTVQTVVSTLSDTESARSPLWVERSLRRHVETARAPFGSTKQAAKALGGTLNTAFLTAAAHAAGQYHDEMGSPVESLRTSMVVSTRTDDSGGNAFSIVRLLAPTSDMPIADRFVAIQEQIDLARDASRSAGLDALAALTAALPTSLITKLARQQGQTIDFATSNVKGSPVPVFLAGAQLLELYPIGPLGGVAFNLTLMSYDGSLDMALNIDAAAVDEPELLADRLQNAFRELGRLAPKA